MIRHMNAPWVLAFGASVVMMAAQAHGAGEQSKTKHASPAPRPQATTLTGCLRVDGNQYRLTNPKGAEAQAGRTWKSGYIKKAAKAAKTVEVVGTSPNVKLIDQVGREVSVSGTSDDATHLRASAIKRLATSCKP
jgi:hypothetical protein